MTDTRRRILDTALDSFTRYGYRRTDVADIAEAAGLSRQGLYKHFASKEALFRAVVEDLHESTLERATTDAKLATAEGPAAVLIALLEGRFVPFFERVYDTPHGVELLSESSRQCSDVNLAATRRFRKLLSDAIAAEVRQGRLDLSRAKLDASTLTELVLRAAYGLKGQDPTPLDCTAFRRSLRTMVELLTDGLVARAEPRSRKS